MITVLLTLIIVAIGITYCFIVPKSYDFGIRKLSFLEVGFDQMNINGDYWIIPFVVHLLCGLSCIVKLSSTRLGIHRYQRYLNLLTQIMSGLSMIGLLYALATPYLFYRTLLPQFTLMNTEDYSECVGQNQAYVYRRSDQVLFHTQMRSTSEIWPLIKSVKSLQSCEHLHLVTPPDGFYKLQTQYTVGLQLSAHTMFWKILGLIAIILIGVQRMLHTSASPKQSSPPRITSEVSTHDVELAGTEEVVTINPTS